jgi:hypothetical protein
MASRTGKFEKLAAQVHSKRLAGWITTHEPKVATRAKVTRAADKGVKRAASKGGSKKGRR